MEKERQEGRDGERERGEEATGAIPAQEVKWLYFSQTVSGLIQFPEFICGRVLGGDTELHILLQCAPH